MGNPGEQLLRKVSTGREQAVALAQMDILRAQLGWEASSALERLLIEHVVTTWLRLRHAERQYNVHAMGESVMLESGVYWEELLTAAQRRHLRAIESLARVRRLASKTPFVQFNIADGGSQQLNIHQAGPADG